MRMEYQQTTALEMEELTQQGTTRDSQWVNTQMSERQGMQGKLEDCPWVCKDGREVDRAVGKTEGLQ